jgi:hypothetical protein
LISSDLLGYLLSVRQVFPFLPFSGATGKKWQKWQFAPFMLKFTNPYYDSGVVGGGGRWAENVKLGALQLPGFYDHAVQATCKFVEFMFRHDLGFFCSAFALACNPVVSHFIHFFDFGSFLFFVFLEQLEHFFVPLFLFCLNYTTQFCVCQELFEKKLKKNKGVSALFLI